MRKLIMIAALALSACGQPAANAVPEDARAGSSGVGRVPEAPFTLEAEALVGLWSFDRSCGLYDLVFSADDRVEYYDYSNEANVVSYAGTWAAGDANRVTLNVRQLDSEGAPSGAPIVYSLSVAAPVTDDLMGDFARAGGAPLAITARRCPDEDRD
ncbi:MAG TPA: hypothetical protein DHW63_11170 [Hyphomonadaceae bacterium]|nr:hypothetical protein [Hyphomonadaceae bacterium]